jgi:hypothetical protein
VIRGIGHGVCDAIGECTERKFVSVAVPAPTKSAGSYRKHPRRCENRWPARCSSRRHSASEKGVSRPRRRMRISFRCKRPRRTSTGPPTALAAAAPLRIRASAANRHGNRARFKYLLQEDGSFSGCGSDKFGKPAARFVFVVTDSRSCAKLATELIGTFALF